MWPSAPCVLTTWTANLVCRLVYKKQMLLCASVVQWKKGNFMMEIFSCLKLLAQTLSISLCSDCLLWLLWFGFWKFDFNMLDDILRGISHNVSQKTVGRKFFVKNLPITGKQNDLQCDTFPVDLISVCSWNMAVKFGNDYPLRQTIKLNRIATKLSNFTRHCNRKVFFFSNLTTLICQTFKYFSFSNKPMQHMVHQKGNFYSPFNP